ncbi:MAG: hypothetical protein Q8N18_24415 [Opitutaceae bacterium]|nr:hypothetical protein [Opitutaceae bacterium]
MNATCSLPLRAILGATLFVSSFAAAHAQPKVEETVVGPVGAGGLYVVSQNDARVAYVGAKGTRTVVSVDGVEGPVLDELFNGSAANIGQAGSVLVHPANAGGKFNGTPSAVIFSESGSSYAYIGRQGNEYVVIHNGKEVGRGPRNSLSLQHSPLTLSPKGNFVFWGEMKTEAGRGQYRLVLNGKPDPWAGHQDLKPVFSPDDKRYACNAGTVADYQKQVLIIDGKVASYLGHTPQWTADSKVLLTIAPGNVVLVDGKPGPYTGIQLEKITPSPVGSRFAVIMRKRNVNNEGVGTLYLDGKEVPGTDGAMNISFSPDGKRWALRCRNSEAKSFFVIIDGKKGTEYQSVADKFFWSPDSTKVIYQITSSGRQFVVVNTEEFPVAMVSSNARDPIVFPKVGSRYAFSSTDGTNRQHLTIVDGKNILPAGLAPNGDSFDFSDDGSRYAFTVSPVGRSDSAGLVIDGKHTNDLFVSGFTGTGWITPTRNTLFKWSPHGKYFARVARRPDNTAAGLYVNEQLAYPTTLQVSHPTFTPDGEHLYWIGAEKFPDRPQNYYVVYADGHPVMKRDADGFLGYREAWSVDAKGVLTFVAADGNQVKRYRISPAADLNIDKMVAATQEKIAKAEAAVIAAKKKAEEEAAAKAAKAKEDADALAAKRKADAEAAAKARADAAAAKAKARQDALDARKKKTAN